MTSSNTIDHTHICDRIEQTVFTVLQANGASGSVRDADEKRETAKLIAKLTTPIALAEVMSALDRANAHSAILALASAAAMDLSLTKTDCMESDAIAILCAHSYAEHIAGDRHMVPVSPAFVPLAAWATANGVSRPTANSWCKKGKIQGAKKMGGNWMVPETAHCPKKWSRGQ